MNKRALVTQLASKLSSTAALAARAGADAVIEAREGATPAERREDARVALEFSGLARGHAQRAQRVQAELALLEKFDPSAAAPGGPIDLGSIIEVESGAE